MKTPESREYRASKRPCLHRQRRNQSQLLFGRPAGRLNGSGALACSEEAETLRRELAQLRQAIVAALRKRFRRAVPGWTGSLTPTGGRVIDLPRFASERRAAGH